MNYEVLEALKKNPAVVRRLRAVQKRVVRYPEKYDQLTFGNAATGEFDSRREAVAASCNTACCVAGHYLAEKGFKLTPTKGEDFDGDQMWGVEWMKGNKIAHPESEMWEDLELDCNYNTLFSEGSAWPSPFCKAFINSTDNKEKARIAVARIEWFIQTGE